MDLTSDKPTHSDRFSTVVTGPGLNRITPEDPWRWLSAGWRDLRANARLSLTYGVLFSGISLALFFALLELEMAALVLVLGGGFMLVGPMVAVGLYEASRRLEEGQGITAKEMLFVKRAFTMQMAYMGLTLMFMFLAWVRLATLIYALFFGMKTFPPIDQFVPELLFSVEGATMLVVGTIVGAGIALAVYAVSVISVPLLFRRDVDFMTAVITSIRAVKENFWPMMLWAWLIALFTAFGIATLFLGMILVFPLVGHASWHAYRALVPRADVAPKADITPKAESEAPTS
ncbi:DUF2189 domain-containing protein [Yunchengibacter salinarum]|uniref:DUF2189 domain-containing protein n=1 Tax=Yunchengibacter salinarum TaxID=3133399 RepID=UPI0035B605E9